MRKSLNSILSAKSKPSSTSQASNHPSSSSTSSYKVPVQNLSGNFTQKLTEKRSAQNEEINILIEQIDQLEKSLHSSQQQYMQYSNYAQPQPQFQPQPQPQPQTGYYMPYMQNISMPQMYIEPIDVELFADCVREAHGNMQLAQYDFLQKLKTLYPEGSINWSRNSTIYAEQVHTKYCAQISEHNMRQQILTQHHYMMRPHGN
jgi:hypothetical protein